MNKRYLVSEHLKDVLKDIYGSSNMMDLEQKSVVISNFAEVPNQADFNSFKKERKLIFLGREAVEKRIHLAGKIAAELAKSDSSLINVFIGPPPSAVDEESAEYIEFTGVLDNNTDIEAHLKGASIVLFTSVYEGLPLALMECMAHGVVPICTAVGGMAVHLEGRENGILIKSEDEDEIIAEGYKHISSLLSDNDLLAKYSRNAYQYATDNFSSTDYSSKIHKFFEID